MEKEMKTIPWKLIIARLKQGLGEEDMARFEQWVSVPENATLFKELQKLWITVQIGCGEYVPDKNYYWKKLCQYVKADRAKQFEGAVRGTRWIYKYAVAACIALLVGVSFYMGVKMSQPEVLGQEYVSLGGKSKITLPDGSLVWLNANSSLSYDNDFLRSKRVVKLSGEAYFDVIHNESLPFVVNSDGVDVIVHGTKFDVESFDKDDYVQVSLQQGAVFMHTTHEVYSLKPGEQGVYHKNSGKVVVAESDVDFAVSWAQEKLEFRDRLLEDICRFLSKWYRVEITVHPSLKGKYKYTFVLRNESLEEILRLMSRIHPIAYQFDEHNILHLDSLRYK